MSWVAVAVGGSNLIGGLIGADAARSAASTQAQSAQNALDFQKQQFATTQAQGAPGRAAGYNALNQLGALGSGTYQMYDTQGNPIGAGTGSDYLTHQFNAEDLKAGLAPNYDFMLGQGQEATNRMANASGGLIGGNALTGLDRYTQDYAGNAYQNAFTNYQNQRTNIYNTLAGIAGLGQQAYGTSASAGTQGANTIGNTIQGIGQAQAAGTVGAANAISGGIQNAGNQYYLSQLLANRNQNTGGGTGGGGGVTAPAPMPTYDTSNYGPITPNYSFTPG